MLFKSNVFTSVYNSTEGHYIKAEQFKGINWLTTKYRVEQPIATKVSKNWNGHYHSM